MMWGNWEFKADNWTLIHKTEQYEIDLEKIQSSAAILDWIFQIQDKLWCDAKTINDLITAFREILDPQKNYCSFEQNLHADGGKLARAFFASAQQNK